MIVPMLGFVSGLLSFLLAAMAIFLILLVLVQRGRGGGLAGALGGMGGSSAFGAKAGDVFTRITAWSALVWIVLCILAAKYGSSGGTSKFDLNAEAAESGGAAAGSALTAPTDESKDGAAEGEKPAQPAPQVDGESGDDAATK